MFLEGQKFLPSIPQKRLFAGGGGGGAEKKVSEHDHQVAFFVSTLELHLHLLTGFFRYT